jgi:hypothetical protein
MVPAIFRERHRLYRAAGRSSRQRQRWLLKLSRALEEIHPNDPFGQCLLRPVSQPGYGTSWFVLGIAGHSTGCLALSAVQKVIRFR